MSEKEPKDSSSKKPKPESPPKISRLTKYALGAVLGLALAVPLVNTIILYKFRNEVGADLTTIETVEKSHQGFAQNRESKRWISDKLGVIKQIKEKL